MTTIAPLGSTDLVKSVINRVDEMIADRSLSPGQRIVEAELCALMGIGRVPVREAIRILAGEGAIDLVAGRSARVRLLGQRQTAEMLRVQSALMTAALDHIIDLSIDSLDVSALQAAQNLIINALDQSRSDQALIGIGEMHNGLSSISGNEFLQEIVRKVRFSHYNGSIQEFCENGAILSSARAHLGLLPSIERHDFSGAKEAIRLSLYRMADSIVRGEGKAAQHAPIRRRRKPSE